MLSHRNLLSNALAAIEALDLGEDDSSLLVLPMHHAMPFIAAVVLAPLIGAHFVIENDLRRIRDRLQEFKPTIFFGVPALYEIIYRNVLARAEAEGRLKTLRRVQRVTGLVKRLTGVNLAPYAFRSISQGAGRAAEVPGQRRRGAQPPDRARLLQPRAAPAQGWGMTEASPVVAVQRFSRRRFRYSNYYERHAGSVGPAIPGRAGAPGRRTGEGHLGRRIGRRRGAGARPQRRSRATGRPRRRRGKPGRTAGCAPATSAASTTRATSISRAAASTSSCSNPARRCTRTRSRPCWPRASCCRTSASWGASYRMAATAPTSPPSSIPASRQRTHAPAASTRRSLRSMVDAEIDSLCKQLATYKRVTRVELSDTPLPKTALRKVARGMLHDSYEFDFETWLRSPAEDEHGRCRARLSHEPLLCGHLSGQTATESMSSTMSEGNSHSAVSETRNRKLRRPNSMQSGSAWTTRLLRQRVSRIGQVGIEDIHVAERYRDHRFIP